MKNQIITKGIVLARTDFREADRILTILTPDNGKLKVIAKGVRRPKSKLAGGIELLSVSNITVLLGRGDMGTLVSTRLIEHFSNIVKDINRTMLTYDILKRINRVTEDAAEEEYFVILEKTLNALNDASLDASLAELWMSVQILSASGHLPNLSTDDKGQKLELDKKYVFDFEQMLFRPQKGGPYVANHIKLFRLASGLNNPLLLRQVTDATACTVALLKLVKNLLKLQIKI